MKPYTVEIEINKLRAEVAEIFACPDRLKHWQTDLQKVECVEGTVGEVGAESVLTFLIQNRPMELKEVLTVVNLPNEIKGTYSWDGGENELHTTFTEVSPNTTKIASTCTYRFKTLMMKAMGFLFPGKFRAQNMSFLRNLKDYCENGVSILGK